METQVIQAPPPKNPRIVTGFDDYIQDLGDRIVALAPKEAKELKDYLASLGIEKPK